MTREDKELLIKDLCARLPYKTKIQLTEYSVTEKKLPSKIKILDYCMLGKVQAYCNGFRKDEIKPYLFPLSSMTKTQKKEYDDNLIYLDYTEGGWAVVKTRGEYIIPYWFVDFCNKNHLDYNGLIEKGLAIDATNLNIY